MKRFITHTLWPWLLPHACLLCQQKPQATLDLCVNCDKALPTLSQCCLRCANPLETMGTLTCGICLQRPPPYDRLLAAFHYKAPIDEFILKFKFHEHFESGNTLSQLLYQRIVTQWYRDTPLPSMIIPVPLAKKRLMTRGFNQSIELAKPIANQLSNLTLETNLCTRVRNTKTQSELPASERAANIRGAFTLTKAVEASHIAIIDDVVTTGNTVSEISRLLKRAGAKRIDVWCCARVTKKY